MIVIDLLRCESARVGKAHLLQELIDPRVTARLASQQQFPRPPVRFPLVQQLVIDEMPIEEAEDLLTESVPVAVASHGGSSAKLQGLGHDGIARNLHARCLRDKARQVVAPIPALLSDRVQIALEMLLRAAAPADRQE